MKLGTNLPEHLIGADPGAIGEFLAALFGGQSRRVLRRAGRLADGWFPYYPWFSEELLHADRAVLLQSAREAGRDPASIGIEGAAYFADPRFEMPPGGRKPPQSFDECIEYARWWERFGATRYWVTAPRADLGPEETGVREPGRRWSGIEARLRALGDFKKALGSGV